jgi:DNA-binding response OmpR family regulator
MMMAQPHVVLIGGSDALLEQCTAALDGLGTVEHDRDVGMPDFGEAPTAVDPFDAELVLLTFARVVQHGLGHVKRIRDNCHGCPLILLAERDDVATNGRALADMVDGIISLPTTLNRLRQKIALLLRLEVELIAQDTALDAKSSLDEQERRHGMRADIPAVAYATVTLGEAGQRRSMRIVDLSLRQAEWLGGMLLAPTGGPRGRRAPPPLEAGQVLPVRIHLPDLDEDITGSARIVAAVRPSEVSQQAIAIQYDLGASGDSDALTKYWLELQLGGE